MTARQRHWLSGLLGAGLVLLLLFIASLDNLFQPDPPEMVELREVRIYDPPPPPPPQPSDLRDSRSAGPALTLAHRESAIVLEIMELDVKIVAGELGDLGAGGWGIGDGSGVSLGTVSLSELDTTPVVVGAPPIIYPREAIERGVDEFQVLVQILIDEEGRAYPIDVEENPFPSFEEDLERYVSRTVFSRPTRLGVPVRAEYLWPLLIKR